MTSPAGFQVNVLLTDSALLRGHVQLSRLVEHEFPTRSQSLGQWYPLLAYTYPRKSLLSSHHHHHRSRLLILTMRQGAFPGEDRADV